MSSDHSQNKEIPFKKRIIFYIMVPVIAVGIVMTFSLSLYLSKPLNRFLEEQFDANLRLSSKLGLRICETYFNQLIDFRLENNLEINKAYKLEALQEIKAITKELPSVEILVIKDKEILICSLNEQYPHWEETELDISKDKIFDSTFNKESVKLHVRYFPFWDWTIISFISTKKYYAPIILANRLLFISTVGVFIAVFLVLLLVFRRSISIPLKRLMVATQNVAQGKLIPVSPGQKNEFGQLILFFNEMIESIKNKTDEVDELISKLKRSLFEKDILLKEIHHRVKNNLQIIISLLGLQNSNVKDKEFKSMLKDSIRRVYSMALVHEKLYQTENLAEINFENYIESLVQHLIDSSINKQQFEIQINADHINLSLDRAIPCGLILNEVINNAIKHAFPDNSPGEIIIDLTLAPDDHIIMSVLDNGVGFKQSNDLFNSGSLGMQLIEVLTDQINGELSIKSNNGTSVSILFPREHVE